MMYFYTKATHDVALPTAQSIFESFVLVPRAIIGFACLNRSHDVWGAKHTLRRPAQLQLLAQGQVSRML